MLLTRKPLLQVHCLSNSVSVLLYVDCLCFFHSITRVRNVLCHSLTTLSIHFYEHAFFASDFSALVHVPLSLFPSCCVFLPPPPCLLLPLFILLVVWKKAPEPKGRSCSQGNCSSPQKWYQNSLKYEMDDSSQWVKNRQHNSRPHNQLRDCQKSKWTSFLLLHKRALVCFACFCFCCFSFCLFLGGGGIKFSFFFFRSFFF